MGKEFKNIIAEKAVIATAISKYNDSLSEIDADDFTVPLYSTAFKVMQEMYDNKTPLSFVNVYTEIRKKHKEFGEDFLAQFSSEVAEVFPDKIIKEVSELGKKRRYAEVLRGLYEQMLDHPVEEVLSHHEEQARGIIKPIKGSKTYGADGIGSERFMNKYIQTGMRVIDEAIHGFMPSQFIVIAARTAGGKTALAIKAAMNMSLKCPALFFSLEMDAEEMELRIACMEAEVDMPTICKGEMSSEQKRRFDKSDIEAVKKYKELIFYDNVYSLDAIKSVSRRHRMRGKLSCIVVDYIQLVRTKVKGDRHVQISEITRELKLLAKECHCPVIALSQLNRLAEGEEPQLSHLRESGSIEQDANVVIFLYQDQKDKGTDNTFLIVAKNRQGRVGKTAIKFKREHLSFKAFSEERVPSFDECVYIHN